MHAKLSFLPTGSAKAFPFDDMHDACREIIRAYGPDRCLWGSAFPCELWCPKTTYAQQIRLFTEELALPAGVCEAVLGKTSYRLYFERSARSNTGTRGSQ